jgi:hypothetical protein
MDPHGNLRVCYGISPFWIGIYLFFIISIVCGFHSYVKVPKGSKGYEPIFYFTLSIFCCYPRYITIILPLNHHFIMIFLSIAAPLAHALRSMLATDCPTCKQHPSLSWDIWKSWENIGDNHGKTTINGGLIWFNETMIYNDLYIHEGI